MNNTHSLLTCSLMEQIKVCQIPFDIWWKFNWWLKLKQMLCLLQIRQSVFLLCHWGPGQWANHTGDHPPLRRAARQILRQCKSCGKKKIDVTWCYQKNKPDYSDYSSQTQVCELDIIFNFEKAYFILDEFLLGGEAQETSKKNVLKAIEQADLLQEVRRKYFLSLIKCFGHFAEQVS